MISSIAGWRWKAWPLPGGIVTRTSCRSRASVNPGRHNQSCGPHGDGSTIASAAVTKRRGSEGDMAGGNHTLTAGAYRLVDHLASGGMGMVYLGERTDGGEPGIA